MSWEGVLYSHGQKDTQNNNILHGYGHTKGSSCEQTVPAYTVNFHKSFNKL